MSETDFGILHHLRSNARHTLTGLSDITGVPVSTVFARVQKLEEKLITRYTSILDFSKMNFFVRVNLAIKAKNRLELMRFLMDHANVNSVFRCKDQDYYIETIFPNMAKYYRFLDSLDDFGLSEIVEHHVIEDIAREKML